MRRLLLIFVVIFSLSSCGKDYREYRFSDIGLHITMPGKYVILDNFPKPSFLDVDGKQIADTIKLQELEADLVKGLLVVFSSDHKNTASFNLAMQTSKTGDFEQYYNFSKNMQHLISKEQMTKYDTAASIFTVDNVKFQKFMTYDTNKMAAQYSGIYLAQVREYYLIIKADYTDKEFGEEMENAILTAKFD